MKARIRPFGVGHDQDGRPKEVELSRSRCDGPCNRVDVPVACLDNSPDEYPSLNLCHECLVDLANELLEVT